MAALGPLLLLIPGLVPAAAADRAPEMMRRVTLGAAAGAAGLAVVVALGLVFGGAVPGAVVHLDAVSGTMLLLVAGVGGVVVDYSRRYLDGDPGQGRFMKWLALTLAAVLVLVIAGNLILLAAAWIATSLGLHQLLVFYPDRPAAVLAARKKFVAARIADGCLVLAVLLAWRTFGSLSIPDVLAAARATAEPGFGVHAIAVLLAFAAMLKSAQFPAHGWLPEVMETPTPVSALLHAGIINAGGFLLVRMGDVVALSAGALDFLLLVGAVTAVFGAAVMLTQASVKVNLAWSTVAQMGFMVMQVGLGAFAAALLHIVAHSLYKAHAFLTAGGVAAGRRPDRLPPLPLRVLLPSLSAAVLLVLLAGMVLGLPATQAPGPAVLGSVLAMALVPTLSTGVASRAGAFSAQAMAIVGAVALGYFALQAGAAWLLGGAVPDHTVARSALTPVICVVTVLAFATLLVLNVARRAMPPGPLLGALYVHLLNGFYVNTLANRLLRRPEGVR
ncbi:NADH-quinone oxidoreductase subunit L [Roseomonas sp. CCTCC AB2023176]|uniref:NADH-quinone oxidoreductase subunit L n=1 Tax=Roseomonas sp. CCTCC AB2023176 TaxID=3342640 RepID=UPI0035E0CAEC